MISYLKGTVAHIQKSSGNRILLILEVNHIGYELQIPAQLMQQLSAESPTIVQIFTHQQVKEDQIILYGFASSSERDLFRQLITVSGVGANLAIALLDTLGLADLVQAIITSNTKMLIKTPGVGGKTAERLALELKTKLTQWRHQMGLPAITVGLTATIREEVEMTLLALGYSNQEISEGLEIASQNPLVANSKDAEDWIRAAISWLSNG